MASPNENDFTGSISQMAAAEKTQCSEGSGIGTESGSGKLRFTSPWPAIRLLKRFSTAELVKRKRGSRGICCSSKQQQKQTAVAL
jgi:hypothetical protein